MLSETLASPSLPWGPEPTRAPALPPPREPQAANSGSRGPFTKCCASSSVSCPEPRLPVGSPRKGLRRLLGVLEDAAMTEIIDMAAKKHQLWVCVLGHRAVRWGGVVRRGGHQCCLAARQALASALGHGTESAGIHRGFHLPVSAGREPSHPRPAAASIPRRAPQPPRQPPPPSLDLRH